MRTEWELVGGPMDGQRLQHHGADIELHVPGGFITEFTYSMLVYRSNADRFGSEHKLEYSREEIKPFL